MSEQNPPPNPGVSEQSKRSGSPGRPEYKPTDAERASVREMVAVKATRQAIAAALGISPVTLRKHFAAELDSVASGPQELTLEGAHRPERIPAREGRPEFEPTDRQREDVKLFKADDWSDDRIARYLGVSRNTLLKHFAAELDAGVSEVRARVLRNLMRESNAGSVTACDRLLKLPGMIAPAERLATPEEDETPVLGKKAQQLREAQTAEQGTSWDSLVPTQH